MLQPHRFWSATGTPDNQRTEKKHAPKQASCTTLDAFYCMYASAKQFSYPSPKPARHLFLFAFVKRPPILRLEPLAAYRLQSQRTWLHVRHLGRAVAIKPHHHTIQQAAHCGPGPPCAFPPPTCPSSRPGSRSYSDLAARACINTGSRPPPLPPSWRPPPPPPPPPPPSTAPPE